MPLSEDDLLPLSALQHLVFCERQCALIHVERAWRDNRLTLEGTYLHGRVHDEAPRRELRGALLIARRVALRSFTLGVSGLADVVEFHLQGPESSARAGIMLQGLAGRWLPFPVEYKRGKPKEDACDEVQLCAQAICLEEMLGVPIGEGSLFYGVTQHRHGVAFTTALRAATKDAALRLQALVGSSETPRARREPKCRSCSLLDICRPDATGPPRSARRFVAKSFRVLREDEHGPQ